jgi:hypothetical protein
MTTEPFDPGDAVEVELVVRLPRGRQLSVREEAPASRLSGGDDVTALALIATAARAAVTRYAGGLQAPADLLAGLRDAVGLVVVPAVRAWCRACGHLQHDDRPCEADITADNDGATNARYAFGVCMCVPETAHGGEEPAAVALQRLARQLDDVRLALKGGGVAYEGDPVEGVGALISAVYDMARAAGVDNIGAASIWDTIEAIKKYVHQHPSEAGMLQTERNNLARIVTRARAEFAGTEFPLGPGVEHLAGPIRQLLLEHRRLVDNREAERGDVDADRAALAVEVEQQRARAERAEGDVARYRAELEQLSMPGTPAGIQKLGRTAASAAADAAGLRREIAATWQTLAGDGESVEARPGKLPGAVRDALGERSWANARAALRSGSEILPVDVRTAGGGLVLRITAPNVSGSVSVYLGDAKDGVIVAREDARRVFLAAMRTLYPTTVIR